MGTGNTAINRLFANPERYADLFNRHIFHGKQIILPEHLTPIKSESDVLIIDKNDKKKTITRYRDIVMRWNNQIDLAILACENQAKVHYAMPVRNMLYDIFQKYISNYHINLVDAENIKDITCFQSDLQQIFGMIKCRQNKSELINYIKENENYFKHIDNDTRHALEVFLGSEKLTKELIKFDSNKGGEVDMCKALDDLYQSGVDEGIQGMIEICHEFFQSPDDIIEKITQKFNLPREIAEKYVTNHIN